MAWFTLSRAYIWKTGRWLDEAWLYFLYSFSECGNNQYFALEAAIPDHGPDVPFRSTYLPDLVTYSSFYNVGFSQSKISVKKCFWQKSNQYLRCFWRWHGTSTLSVTHLMVHWYLWSYVCNAKGKVEGHWGVLFQLTKPFMGLRPMQFSIWKEREITGLCPSSKSISICEKQTEWNWVSDKTCGGPNSCSMVPQKWLTQTFLPVGHRPIAGMLAIFTFFPCIFYFALKTKCTFLRVFLVKNWIKKIYFPRTREWFSYLQ